MITHLIITGKPDSGKSTLAKQLQNMADRLKTPIVYDEVVDAEKAVRATPQHSRLIIIVTQQKLTISDFKKGIMVIECV